jgi:hypothetical protein
MANREMQLVSRIVHNGDLSTAIEWGITPQDFLTNEGRAMFNHILGYYAQQGSAGSVIGPQVVQQLYPTFVRCDDPGMTTEALCLEVRKQRLAIEGVNRLDQLRLLFDQDPIEAIRALQGHTTELLNIGTSRDTDVTLGSALERIITKYEMLESGIDLSCGRWPWEVMNEATGGIQPDDYIIFYGRPKSMKSWMLAYFIAHAFNQNKRAIIYTKEMTADNIFQRAVACMAGINYQDFRRGKLIPEEKQAIYAIRSYIHALQASNHLVCLSGQDAPEGQDTVPWLQSKVEKYDPDFVFIDGMYLMSDFKNAKKENQQVKNISRALRQMILQTHKPVICTLQANRAAAKNQDANLDEIAFSDAMSQDATCIIRVINEKDAPTCQLVIGGSREFELNGFRVHGVPAYDFGYYGPISAKEIEDAKKHDAEAQDDPRAHARPRSITTENAAARQTARIMQKRL